MSTADLVFTAPQSGTYTLNASFIGEDPMGPNVVISILDNGTSLFSRPYGSLQPLKFAETVALKTGDTLDSQVVSNTSILNTYSLSTGVEAVITLDNTVPTIGGTTAYRPGE